MMSNTTQEVYYKVNGCRKNMEIYINSTFRHFNGISEKRVVVTMERQMKPDSRQTTELKY